ncbi:MAG TPA: MAPEG family protein [Polyangiaceae bacterium]|nr:MAPEG family protein [Polyangiaceae bacterium]
MHANAVTVYVLSVIVLFAKTLATITVQAVQRLRSRQFRYPEDAAEWKGTAGPDNDVTQRAQNLLRNDAETQIFYLALGAAYALIGNWPPWAPVAFTVYPLSRLVHAYFFLRPRQPHRNRAFSLGLIVLALLAGHLAYVCIVRLAAD